MRRLGLALALAASLAACGAGSMTPTAGPLPTPVYDPLLACSGSAALGITRLQIGFAGGDVTATKPGFDLRYQYIAGVLAPAGVTPDCLSPTRTNAVGCGTQWWGTWQWDQLPPGQFVRDFVASAAAAGLRPMLTYYVLLPASGVAEGRPEVSQAARDGGFMARYLADFRFLLRQIGAAPAIVHVEPDFWGYAQHEAAALGTTADHVQAAVASANPSDCGAQPDTVAGLGNCLVAMTRAYAPNAIVALHGSPWASGYDCVANTSGSVNVAAEAAKTAAFLTACAPTADLTTTACSTSSPTRTGWRGAARSASPSGQAPRG